MLIVSVPPAHNSDRYADDVRFTTASGIICEGLAVLFNRD